MPATGVVETRGGAVFPAAAIGPAVLMSGSSAGWLTVGIACWLAGGVVVLARRRSEYDHARHTISELGETGARDQRAASYGVFLPVGVGAVVIAILAGQWGARVMAGSVAVGYLVAVVAPCDEGCPPRGSTRNSVHLLGGVVEYVGLLIGLVVLALSAGASYALPAAIVGSAIVAGGLPAASRWTGLIQRVAEAASFAALAAATI